MAPTLRALAVDTFVHAPPRPGFEQIRTPRWTYASGTLGASVAGVRLEPGEVEQAVEEIRALAQEHAQRDVTWWVGDSATPPDVVERLTALGLVPDEDAPFLTAMAIDRRPDGGSTVDVRRVTDPDEYVRALEIDWEVWNLPAEDREARRASALETWAGMAEQGVTEHYVAHLDGEAVAVARGLFLDGAGVLLGGATLEHARGRGVYTSLVHARWDDAVARGTPALVVQAGQMSRPILERLGFQAVGRIDLLVDRIAN